MQLLNFFKKRPYVKFKKSFNILYTYGPIKLIKYIYNKINFEKSYHHWIKQNSIEETVYNEQKKFKYQFSPLISIIVPTYQTPETFIRDMITSVKKQSYDNWELCIADGSPDNSIEWIIKEYSSEDNRIKYVLLNENLGISGNTNEALKIATGEYIALLDHDDMLAPNALYEIILALNENSSTDCIYTDEDKISFDSLYHFHPNFKPDFNLDLLRSSNYICHFFVVKKSIVDEIHGFRSMYDGSQDYDFILRCVEHSTYIKHIPKILYHWRMHPNSVSENLESKLYAFESGKKAIESHYSRLGINAKVSFTNYLGYYKTTYPILKSNLVSIIILNNNSTRTLRNCINSILEKTTYKNYEIIIVENNSNTPNTFKYYKKLENISNIKIVSCNESFNYSKMNNFGVKHSSGDYIVFLNNDTLIINPNWLTELLSNCQRSEVGIVGAKLLYPNKTIQHAGIVLGLGGIAGHIFCGAISDDIGYAARAILQQNYSAVTGACLIISKDLFNKVDGFDINLPIAYNDVDLCLKVHSIGFSIVYNPSVTLYHYESRTRGKDNTPQKVKRLLRDSNYIIDKWYNIFNENDPNYNPNLSLKSPNCLIKL